MPLIKREVEPVFVSQVDIGKDIKDELECVTNYTLASIIRQLGNLGKHAEDIFGDLLHEATSLARRAGSVQDRLDKMTDTLNNLDPLTDSVSLRDINTRLAFQSSLILDAEVVSSPTMPSAMKATYTRCEQPPPLSQLNQFRQDGKDGLKLYTDPKFFFERWKNEQHKDIDKKKKKKKQKRPHSSNVSRPKKVVTTKEKYKDRALGEEFAAIEREKQAKEKAASGTPPPNDDNAGEGGNKRHSQLTSPPTTPKKATPDSARRRGPQRPTGRAPPPAPAPPPPTSNGVVDDSSLPPPPPLNDDSTYSEVGDMPPPPPDITGNIVPPPPGVPGAPPVPPPPPVPLSAGPAPPPPPPLPAASSGGPPLPKQNSGSANPRPTTAVSQVTAPRDDLLSAIKQGMQLRRVDVKVKDRPSEPENNSVEAILRRRIAVELSSDEETGSDVSDDSDWEDDD